MLASFAVTGWLAAKPAAKSDLASVPTEDLIARFQEMPEESIADVMVTSEGFIPLDRPLRLGTGILADPALTVMRELIRRGAAAVPALLDHLSDARPTRMRVSSGETSQPVEWRYGTGYSPRNPDLTDLPPGVTRVGTSSEAINRSESYQFVVGDLCFVTLGQIVNRYLPASYDNRRDPLFINSPVHSPALAAAARTDWSGLTAEGLKQSLIEDAQRVTDDPPTVDSLQRLLFYYPDDGRALAVQFLQRPVCSFRVAGTYPIETLLATEDEKKQDRLLAELRGKYGEEAYRLLTQSLILTANETPNLSGNEEWDREDAQQLGNAKRIVARHFAAMNQHPHAVEINVDCGSQRAIVETVEAYPSHEIDQAMHDLLKRTLALRPTDTGDKLSQCWLASACMQRLAVPALRRTIEEEGNNLGDMPSDKSDAKTKRAYIRHCDQFLQKWVKKIPPE